MNSEPQRSRFSDVITNDTAGAILTIDVDAICENYRMLEAKACPAACGAVVKADAYGLGAAKIAPALAAAGCRQFFVAHLEEGMALAGLLPEQAHIFVLNGLPPGTEALCAEAGLIPVLNSLEQLRAWSALAAQGRSRLPAAIQIDSGMSRLGLSPEEVEHVAGTPALLAHFDLRLVMSHLACADEPNNTANADQLASFLRLQRLLPAAPLSLANSSGIFLGADFHLDLVRPGAALYGLAPRADAPNPMRPVVSLAARVVQLRTIERGAFVGYGATFRAERTMRIATISVGYADGWLRSLGNAGAAWFGATRLPIIGRVSMDSATIDVTDLPEGALVPGMFVELIGPHQSADEVAAAAGTIGYEILTSLGQRYHRQYFARRAEPAAASLEKDMAA